MKLVTFTERDGPRTGLLLGEMIVDLAPLARSHNVTTEWGSSMLSLIQGGDRAVRWLSELAQEPPEDVGHPSSSKQLQAPIPRPARNIFCVGLNYQDHATETGISALPLRPTFFTKPPSAVIGPHAPIPLHPVTSQLDYEVELGVVIGRRGRDIRASAAYDYVFGYTIINDVTARDLQAEHGGQWFKGKALDGSCPMGPAIVHKGAIPDPHDLEILCRVNGELRQQSNTRLMLFRIPDIIASLSAGMSLEPGDVIATGTPAGVGKGFSPPRYLNDNDVVEMSITGLGTLTNRVEAVRRG